MKFKDFFNMHENKKNKQIKFELKKKKLKEFDIDIKELLNTDLKRGINKFKGV